MRTFPTIVILLTLVACKQSSRKIIDKYPNGQVKTEYIYSDKSDTSRYAYNIYYANGKLKHKTQVVSGMFVGDKISYYQNGGIERVEKLSSPTMLDDARYDCEITNYRSDGTKESNYKYEHSKINGLATDYDSSGNVARTAEYIDGKMNGKEVLYFPNGKISNIAFLKNDTLSGFDIAFKENGDTLKWFHSGEFGLNGLFYKKWFADGHSLTGNYGDHLRSYVVWKWFDKNQKEIKTKVERSKDEKYIAPE